MLVNIKGRIVIICGPVSTGKTNLGFRLVNEFALNKGEVLQYNCTSKREFTKEKSKQQKAIERAVKKYEFVVIDCDGIEREALYELIIALRLFYNGSIDLIKMALPEDLHYLYWKKNKNKKNIPEELIKKQRADFFEEIIPNDITIKDVNEIKVTSLKRLKITFDVNF